MNSPAEYTLAVEYGALLEVPPTWQVGKNVKNWAATITGINPAAPGGYDREFWRRAPRSSPYVSLLLGDLFGEAVVFSGSEHTRSGRIRARRDLFGVVTHAEKDCITIREYGNARAAWNACRHGTSSPITAELD